MPYQTLNPTTGELIESFAETTEAELDAALNRSARAFAGWRSRPLDDRRALLRAAADLLESRKTGLAELLALEMGKPVAEGEAEAAKCAWVCRYYADEVEAILANDIKVSDGSAAFVRRDPLGPLLAIMPWNFPLWQVFRFLAPATAAGNVVLLKHAPSVPRSALAIVEILNDAGAPEGVLENLFLSNDQAAAVISDPRVRGVTLTGSSRAGRAVGAIAGAHLKPMVMELGGSDPFIVFADADLPAAAKTGALSRCLNSGQSCIAAKRFLVEESGLEEFMRIFESELRLRKVGDPMNRDHAIGPLAREDLRDTLARQVTQSVEAGAKVAYVGEAPERGFFYPPTLLTDTAPGMPAHEEELFGPVAVVGTFSTEDEAVAEANRTIYGLGSSLWTGSRERVERLVPRIDAGSVFVNGLVKSDPRLPFGGVKDSGFGRELSHEGLLAFVNQKTVWIA